MANLKVTGEDWDSLSDEDWNKKLDDKIEEFNAGRGTMKLPPAATAIMDEEYTRGVNNKLVTEDLIRHFADACGDPNPFWRDPTYAGGTRWGGIIAPPLYETCIAFGSAFGGRLRVPGIARLAGTYRRGAKTRYWEDVTEGELLPVVMRGPVDVADSCARTTVSCYSYAYAIKWACMRNHLSTHPIDPDTGEYFLRRDWHYRDHEAQVLGYPMANAAGIQNEMMLTQAVTDWMGDDAFVVAVDSQDRKMVFYGDITYVKGFVAKKYVDARGSHLVDVQVDGVNQDGVTHTRSIYTIKLVCRAEFGTPLTPDRCDIELV